MKVQAIVRMVALALLAGVMFAGGRALAEDTLKLADGRVLTGEVVRELEGYVWFKYSVGGIERTQMFKPTEIQEVERDTTEATHGTAPEATPDDTPAIEPHTGVTRAAVITLGEGGHKDMVGIYMTAYILKEIFPLLEEEKIDVVVFRINSGGGLGLEVQRLSDEIQNEYKPRFRVVGWIESAISAAAMTAHTIEEVYMLPNGNYGACTGFYSLSQAVEGRELEESLYEMEKISQRGRRDPKIMRAMQIREPLSCDIDENGDVIWYQNLEGEIIVNPKGRILTFNANTAEQCHFSQGTAPDIDTLAKMMGYTEIEWVGKEVSGVPYPVCKAEQVNREFRNKIYEDEQRTNEYFIIYNQSVSIAQGTPKEDRGKFVNRARKYLNRIKSIIKTNPNFALLRYGSKEQFDTWVAQQEKLLRDLMK
jgi:hypothetical protein